MPRTQQSGHQVPWRLSGGAWALRLSRLKTLPACTGQAPQQPKARGGSKGQAGPRPEELTSWLIQRSSSTAPSSIGSYWGRRGGLNTPFPALQATGSLCQSPRWTAYSLSAPARALQPQRLRALTRRLGTHRLWSVLWSQASNFGTVDFQDQGQIILGGGPSWAPWGVKPHFCPHPFNVRTSPVVTTTDVPRHCQCPRQKSPEEKDYRVLQVGCFL